MNYYQKGYDKGYADALEGKRERGMFEEAFSELLDIILGDEDQREYEEGYGDGYEAGKKEREDNE